MVKASTDGAANREEAEIVEQASRMLWVKFQHTRDAKPGQADSKARATDELMMTQPNTVVTGPAALAKCRPVAAIIGIPLRQWLVRVARKAAPWMASMTT